MTGTIRVQPPFVTEAMAALKVECSSCGATSRPDFWKRHDEPFEPIPSGDGTWHQVSVGVQCQCGETNFIPVPTTELTNRCFLYADKAYRQLEGNFVAVYSFLGGTSGYVDDAEAALSRLKESVFPNLDPARWVVHATKMMSGQQRLQHAHYQTMTIAKVSEFFDGCAAIIKNLGEGEANTCIVAAYPLGRHRPQERARVQNSIERGMVLGLMGHVIYNTTGSKLLPVMTFDAQTQKAIDNRYAGRARDAYFGSRNYLGHLFVTHSNDVPAPTTARPGSHALLELADVHAYFVARSVERQMRKLEVERPLEGFGLFSYLGMKSDQRIEFVRAHEIPKSHFTLAMGR